MREMSFVLGKSLLETVLAGNEFVVNSNDGRYAFKMEEMDLQEFTDMVMAAKDIRKATEDLNNGKLN